METLLPHVVDAQPGGLNATRATGSLLPPLRERGLLHLAHCPPDHGDFIRIVSALGRPTPPWDPFSTSDIDPVLQNIELAARSGSERPRSSSQYWHSDVSFSRTPPNFTALLCLRAAEFGGQTEFVDLRRLLERAPDKVSAVLAHAQARHSFGARLADLMRGKHPAAGVAGLTERFPDVWHPLIRQQHGTGRRSLFVSPLSMVGYRSPDHPPSTVRAAVQELLTLLNEPGEIYPHHWRPGDVLIWDNTVMMHRRSLGPVRGHRELLRVSTEGVPVRPGYHRPT